MVNCPVKECGRKFQNQQTMLQHVRRRHPVQYPLIKQDITKSIIEKQHVQQQQLNKLPKLAKLMSRQKKGSENSLRSDSKTKKTDGASANLANIIQQSRSIAGTNKTTLVGRRPSLTKKISSTNLSQQIKIDKLPPIQKQIKKTDTSFVEKKISSQSKQSMQQFYTTMPNFKTLSGAVLKSRSKSKKKSLQKQPTQQQKQKQKQKQATSGSATLRNTMITLASQKITPQISTDKKKNLLRPTKKLQKKKSEKTARPEVKQYEQKFDFDQKIVNISSWPESTFDCPSKSKIQMLYLNNCGLSNIILNSLQSLIQLSLTGNKLRDMQFLRYQKNHNIKIIHIDHNQLTQIYTPPKLKVLTASFNKIKAESLQQVCAVLRKSPEMEEIDFSFNNLRKAQNYKLRIIGACGRIKKIDGLTVTRIDRDMFEEFNRLQYKHKGLIPLGSPSSQRPTTATSQYQPQSFTTLQQPSTQTQLHSVKTIAQLQKQQTQYEKQILQTQQQLKTIMQENEVVQEQLKIIKEQNKQLESNGQISMLALLQKLKKQCQFLELLNVMQYADQEELVGMIRKKKIDLGIACQ